MKKQKLSIKIIGGFVMVAVITLGVGLVGWRGVSTLGTDLSEVGEVRLPSVYNLQVMREAMEAIKSAQRTLLIPTLDRESHERQYANIGRQRERYQNARATYEPLPQTPEEATLWKQFVPALEAWRAENNKFFELSKELDQVGGTNEALYGKMYEQAMVHALAKQKEALDLLDKIIQINNDVAAESLKHSTADAAKTKWVALLGMILGPILALGLGFWLSRSISRPIQRVAEGLGDGADQVAAASGQVSTSSQQLAEGASQQAAAIEETSSSLEEMSSMTKQNADNARQADSLMRDTNTVVVRANDSMNALSRSMVEVSKASDETRKIIKTIDEIAFQTNLLALNAAVEAARAGEAGAGFAVVADEVRNLAMRAAEAAKNTAALIEGTVTQVSDGMTLVEQTNTAFADVTRNCIKVGELVGEIAAASAEQAQGVEQINRAINEMDKVVQQNAANAEESASASEEMNAQAEQMKAYVGELTTLVEGEDKRRDSGDFSQGRVQRVKATVNHRGPAARSVSRAQLGAGNGKASGKGSMVPSNGRNWGRTPEEVFPLADEGLSDF